MRGKVAFVTGAGSSDGIGFAVARRLAGEGAAVALGATSERIHDRAEDLRRQGARALGVVADMTDRGQAAAAAAEIEAELGPIDVLVNNAGMTRRGEETRPAPFAKLDPAEWDRQLEMSLTSAFNVTRLVLPGMLERGWGRVVIVGSVTGPLLSYPGQAAYAAARRGSTG